jgi:hypothetical protein
MSRLRSTVEGHRLGVGESGGLRDKLSNAQLLQQYQDLLRENAQLKNIGNKCVSKVIAWELSSRNYTPSSELFLGRKT